MLPDKPVQWFEDWFDSSYYHILYKHRDYTEAEVFISNLINYLRPKENSKFLDLGCGKGRHVIYLQKKGFDVTGIDLSPQSIIYAKQVASTNFIENERPEFYIQDMRKPFRINYYDYVLNLFTSFGYFDKESDNYAVINSVSKSLKPKGTFVFDFLNSRKVTSTIIENEIQCIDHIEFKITRRIENNFILKTISFTDGGKDYCFREKVQLLNVQDMIRYFTTTKLKIVHLFGNYQLDDFNENNSDRLIIITQKE